MHPEKVLGLTRRLLRSATLGGGRYAFLQEISRMLLEFSGCDTLEIIHKDGELNYQWKAAGTPEPFIRFWILPPTDKGAMNWCLSQSAADKLFRQIINTIEYNPTFASYTPKGSFWSNDVQCDSGLLLNAIRVESETDQLETYRSLAVIPFTINPTNFGVIQLKSAKIHFFSPAEIRFYEGVAQTFGLAASDRRAQSALRERVKEQTCLYSIARIVEAYNQRPSLNRESLIEEQLREIVELLPPAWQHPKIAVGRIILDDRAFCTINFHPGTKSQSADIVVAGKRRGRVEVQYVEDRREVEAQPFLPEEENLITEVARQIGLIVERAESQGEREQLQEQVRHADRLATIGELAAGVAHEINEPLGSILGFTQLVKKKLIETNYHLQEEDASLTRLDLERIERASLHARDIVRNLLIFARQLPAKKEEVNLNAHFDMVASLFYSRCDKQRISLIIRKDPGLPSVIADPTQISQMLVNLIVNSIHAMPRGGELSLISGVPSPSENVDPGMVFMKVRDTGVGIDEKIRDKIFLPFFTTKDVDQGTGLGLSVVHGIVKEHNGQIKIESKVGKGTTFTIYLPSNGVAIPSAGKES